MRRFAMIALILMATAPLMAQSHRIDAVDPPRDGRYPGSRGPDQLIVYTPACGHPTTGTNEWGGEAVVEGGIVVSSGTNDSAIPEDGFVVSGHGEARNWINQHLPPGTPVTHDGAEVRVDDSPAGLFACLQWRLGRLREALSTPEELGLSAEQVEALAARIEEIQALVLVSPGESMAGLAEEVADVEQTLWLAQLAQIPSPEGEVRGVWHRVTQSTPEDLAGLAQALADAHVNVFCPETIYGSQAIFNDTTGLFPLFERYAGIDPLAVLIEECHARGIEVHAWVHCFFIGIQGNAEEPPGLADRHPEWLAQNREGHQATSDESGYMFINPAHPEARRALIDAHVALAENYDIDGFQFDYIRYSDAGTWERGWDYSDFTRERVREELGFDPLQITPDENPDQWSQWLAWREEQITSFVREASAALRAARPGIVLTADVFAGLDYAIAGKGQNWAAWGREGLVDALIPMAYTVGPADVRRATAEMRAALPAGPTVIGLGPYLGLTPQQLVDQIVACREEGASGQVLFCWDRLTPEAIQALTAGPWRTPTAAVWTRPSE